MVAFISGVGVGLRLHNFLESSLRSESWNFLGVEHQLSGKSTLESWREIISSLLSPRSQYSSERDERAKRRDLSTQINTPSPITTTHPSTMASKSTAQPQNLRYVCGISLPNSSKKGYKGPAPHRPPRQHWCLRRRLHTLHKLCTVNVDDPIHVEAALCEANDDPRVRGIIV